VFLVILLLSVSLAFCDVELSLKIRVEHFIFHTQLLSPALNGEGHTKKCLAVSAAANFVKYFLVNKKI
jgi:hypothetical protein